VKFTEESEFSMIIIVRARGKFTDGWKDSKAGGRMLMVIRVVGYHRL